MLDNIDSEKFPGCFYEILEMIGSGGQATVYLALLKRPCEDTVINEGIYAAKVISQAYLLGDSP